MLFRYSLALQALLDFAFLYFDYIIYIYISWGLLRSSTFHFALISFMKYHFLSFPLSSDSVSSNNEYGDLITIVVVED